jgi:hypothetical protein
MTEREENAHRQKPGPSCLPGSMTEEGNRGLLVQAIAKSLIGEWW